MSEISTEEVEEEVCDKHFDQEIEIITERDGIRRWACVHCGGEWPEDAEEKS
jgi:hypothetical protein